MKKSIFFLLLFACTAMMGAKAQVVVRVNGGTECTLDTAGGIYFANDTMRVVGSMGDSAAYALDEVSVVTFHVQSAQGIAEALSAEMSIAPVPARHSVSVSGIGSEPQKVTMYNAAGQQVLQQMVSDGSRISIESLPQGMYLLRCGSRVSKIVKQ